MPEENDTLNVKFAKLETKVDYIITELKDMKDNSTLRLDRVEENKADKKEVQDIKNDVKTLNRYLYMGLGGLTVIDLLIYYYIHH